MAEGLEAVAEAPQGQTTTGGENPEQAQAGQAQQPAQPQNVNLDDLPEFRQWKSNADRRIAQQEQQYRQQMQRQRAEYEARLAERMRPEERQKFDTERLQRERDEALQQLNQYQQERAYYDGIAYITQETGVPMEHLDLTGTPEQAWASAARWLRNNNQQQAQSRQVEEEQDRKANSVDLGGGSPPQSKATKLRDRYKAAQKSFNTFEMMRVLDEAEEAGVTSLFDD